MAESLEPYYGCRGEIRPGKPGTTKFDRDGNVIHLVDQETWKNTRETLGIVEERIEENSFHDILGKFKNIPPHFRPDYKHSGDIIKLKGETK
jgi:hypothetical protein|nr:MAG TPA: Meh1 [Caudoviricetes sp.]